MLGNDPTKQPSRVTFGGADANGFTGELFTYEMTENLWSLPLSDVKLNSISISDKRLPIN